MKRMITEQKIHEAVRKTINGLLNEAKPSFRPDTFIRKVKEGYFDDTISYKMTKSHGKERIYSWIKNHPRYTEEQAREMAEAAYERFEFLLTKKEKTELTCYLIEHGMYDRNIMYKDYSEFDNCTTLFLSDVKKAFEKRIEKVSKFYRRNDIDIPYHPFKGDYSLLDDEVISIYLDKYLDYMNTHKSQNEG